MLPTDKISDLNFELVSGLEIHVQLNTKTKIFSAESAAFGGAPNAHTSAVSLALPGTLPKLNKAVIEKAVRMGLALNCTINQVNTFDRKNYFYADLPKGYQLTQDRQPICINGNITVVLEDGSEKNIRINRIHLEEDAGKSLHDRDAEYSYVDLNRAGVPLIEIVTEPDIRTANEASALVTEIRKLSRYLDISDGNMEEGSLRCDANISIRPAGTAQFGTRCEVKNLNSIRNLRKALAFEFRRQVEVVTSGGTILQSTLNFDAETGTTSPMRIKEEANDYRYFPDPDLLPVFISDSWLSEIQAGMPKLPQQLMQELIAVTGITRPEAALMIADEAAYTYYQSAVPHIQHPKSLVKWMLSPLRALLSDRKIDFNAFEINPVQLAAIINLVDEKKITQQNALHKLIPALEKMPGHDVFKLAETLQLLIEDNTAELERLINETLTTFKVQVAAYKNGKKGLLGLFVGEIMKLSHGKADPQRVNALLLEKLNT